MRKTSLLAAGLLALYLAGTSAGSAALGFPRSASVGGPASSEVHSQTGAVTIISTRTDKVTATVRVGQIPGDVAVMPDSKLAFVADTQSGTVTEFRTASGLKVRRIRAGACPGGMALGRGGRTLYIAARKFCGAVFGAPPIGRGLLRVATATGKKGRIIPIANPDVVAITPSGRTAFVGDFNANGQVTPVSLTRSMAYRPIIIGGYPYRVEQIAFGPHGSDVYVLSDSPRGGGRLTAISASSRRILWSLHTSFLDAMAVTPDGRYVYALTINDGVAVIRASTHKIIKQIKVRFAFTMVMAPDGKTVYVSSADPITGFGGITPISTATNTAAPQITVSRAGDVIAIAISANSQTAYVGLGHFNAVVPVDLATGTPEAPISVGVNLASLQLTPNGQMLLAVRQG